MACLLSVGASEVLLVSVSCRDDVCAVQVAMLSLALLVALLVDDLGIMFSFVGATGATMVSFILPGAAYYHMHVQVCVVCLSVCPPVCAHTYYFRTFTHSHIHTPLTAREHSSSNVTLPDICYQTTSRVL